MDAYSIFEASLNLKTVTVRDKIDDGDGKYHYVINRNETMLAREKQNLIKEKFKMCIRDRCCTDSEGYDNQIITEKISWC